MKSIGAAVVVLAAAAWYIAADKTPHINGHESNIADVIRFWSIVLGVAGAIAWAALSFAPSRLMHWMEREN